MICHCWHLCRFGSVLQTFVMQASPVRGELPILAPTPLLLGSLCQCMTDKHTVSVYNLQGLHSQANADSVPVPSSETTSDITKTIKYLPQALQYVAHNCRQLRELSLRLTQAASGKRGGAWDHPSLLKRPHFKLSQFWSHCKSLHSLALVNVPSR